MGQRWPLFFSTFCFACQLICCTPPKHLFKCCGLTAILFFFFICLFYPGKKNGKKKCMKKERVEVKTVYKL